MKKQREVLHETLESLRDTYSHCINEAKEMYYRSKIMNMLDENDTDMGLCYSVDAYSFDNYDISVSSMFCPLLEKVAKDDPTFKNHRYYKSLPPIECSSIIEIIASLMHRIELIDLILKEMNNED